MDEEENLLDQYFDRDTPSDVKKVIKEEIQSKASVDDKILLELGDAIKIEQDVQHFKDRIEKINPVNKKPNRWYLKIAASFAVLVVFSFFMVKLYTTQKSSTTEVFLSYYTPYDGIVTTRNSETPILNGITVYNSGNYEKALAIFLEEAEIAAPNDSLSLLIGSCYLSLNKSESAIEWLGKVSQEKNKLITGNRDWYLALAYINEGEVEKSRQFLLSLVKEDSPFKNKATKLLQEPIFD